MRDGDEAPFAEILAVVHGATGIDFSLYREKTIKRRVLRRLALRNIDSLAEYAAPLEDDAEELTALQRDLLISVTSFFRDPGSFESLNILSSRGSFRAARPRSPIRVWVPGCATGEEAFSIAITLSEYMNETGASFPVQIFASDISEQAIEKARAGQVPGEYCGGHFRGTPEPVFHQDGRRLPDRQRPARDVRIHAAQPAHRSAVLQAGPGELPQRADLSGQRAEEHHPAVPLRTEAQRVPHAGGLRNGGVPRAVFVSGPRAPDLFQAGDPRKPYPFRSAAGTAFGGGAANKAAEPPAEGWDGQDVRGEVDRLLLSRYSPAGVVVDEELEVLEIRGKAGSFLSLPSGKVELQPSQTDPRDRTVPGNGKAGP